MRKRHRARKEKRGAGGREGWLPTHARPYPLKVHGAQLGLLLCPQINFKFAKLGGDRFDPEFLEKRRSAFEKYLNRMLSHARVSQSKAFYSFLKNQSWGGVLKMMKDDKVQTWAPPVRTIAACCMRCPRPHPAWCLCRVATMLIAAMCSY